MNQQDLFLILKATGFPVTYLEWPQGRVPPLPYLVFMQNDDDRFLADNVVFYDSPRYAIELYSKKKDNVSEQLLKDALQTHEIVWMKEYEDRTDEGLYLSAYSI